MSSTGHGHVTPRADGAKARCGGPTLCLVCAREARQLMGVRIPRKAQPARKTTAATPPPR